MPAPVASRRHQFLKLRKEKYGMGSCLERSLILWSAARTEGLLWKSLPFTSCLGRPTSTVNPAEIGCSMDLCNDKLLEGLDW